MPLARHNRLYLAIICLLAALLIIPWGCSRPSSKRVELVNKRTRYGKIFQNADGTRSAEIYVDPIHYKDARGRWREIDTTITNYEVKQAPFKATFGTYPQLKFEVKKSYLKLQPLKTKKVAGKTKNSVIIYEDAYSSADLKYSVGSYGVKEEIILKDRSSPTSFAFRVDSNRAAELEENQRVDFGDFQIPPPVAIDSKGKVGAVNLTVGRSGKSYVLTLEVDPGWLEEARFPVTIDPTIVTQPDPLAGKDTFVDSAFPDNNYGSSEFLYALDGSRKVRSLVQFNLESIPGSSTITSASISLYVSSATGGQIKMRRVTLPWVEGTGVTPVDGVTWNTQPSFEEVSDTGTLTSAGVWESWNATALVRDWFKGAPNHGVVFISEETGASGGGQFYSSDYSLDPTLRPRLVINYDTETVAPVSKIAAPANNSFLAGSIYTISGTASDSGSGVSKVEVSTDGGVTYGLASGTSSWSYDWSLPADGVYLLRSKATDKVGNVESPSTDVRVTIDNTAPTGIITYPTSGLTVSGTVEIKGTAKDTNFKNYRVLYGEGSAPSSWSQAGIVHTTEVDNGLLGRINTRSLGGTYTFKLVVEDRAKNVTSYSATIGLDNKLVRPPHKNYPIDTELCALCHRSHTGVAMRILTKPPPEAELCYSCHDGLGSIYNTRNDFDSYANHHPIRDQKYASDPVHTQDCSTCHNTHGNKDETTGVYYSRLLRITDSQGNKIYQGNNYCGVCHGANASGSGYALGGDHITNFSGLAAHDTKTVEPSSGTKIKCSNCHKPHGGPNYRLNQSREEELCFSCHNSASLPNTLNNWDVQAHFAMTSSHAITSNLGAKVECSSCHGPHIVQPQAGKMLSNPDNTRQLWLTSITNFCLVCHDSNPPARVTSSTVVVPYTIVFPGVTAPFFPGWDKFNYVFLPAGMSATATCATCHHPHGSANDHLVAYNYDNSAAYSEEKLCLTCHKSGGPPGAADLQSLLTKTYKHPTDTVTGVHKDTEAADNLAHSPVDSKRHSECTDCHNPHEATNASATAPATSGKTRGVGGVRSDGAVINPIVNQYELCLKCHSSYTSQPLGQGNKLLEFDAANNSYHPVESIGRNSGISPSAFVGPWTWDKVVYCTDCHGNDDPAGANCPLGSNNANILKKPYTSTDRSLCFDCHSQTTYTTPGATGSRWVGHNGGLGGHQRCQDCHETHGNKQDHLMNRGYDHYVDGGRMVTDNKCTGSGCHANGIWIRYFTSY